MAREIKFRAWDTRGKSWLYPYPEGFHLFGETTCFDLIRDQMHERYPGESSLLLMNEVEVVQYTGLKDKNGKEVYEGDVLQFSDKWEWYRGQFGGGWLATQADKTEVETNHVKYPYERRVVNLPSDYEWLLSSEIQTYFEVIGNIYENPDLLDKQT